MKRLPDSYLSIKGWLKLTSLSAILLFSGLSFSADVNIESAEIDDSQIEVDANYQATCPSVEACEPLIRKLKKYAKNGYPKAQLMLAVFYLHGDGLDKDLEQAMRWAKRAATQKYPLAKRVISSWYRHGTAGETNLERADYFLKDAAGLGDAKAMLAFGAVQLRSGKQKEAEELFLLASEKGDATAKKILELMALAKDEKGIVDLNANVQLPSSTEQGKSEVAAGENVMRITASYEPLDMLRYFIANVDPAYSHSHSTGSRLPGVRCGISSATSPCQSWSPNGDRILSINEVKDDD